MSAEGTPAAQAFRLCSAEELPEGRVRSGVLGGRPVAVVRQDGALFAFGGLCPHQHADLGEGLLEPGAIRCADHLWRFELASGRCSSVPGARLPLYAVREQDGAIVVELVPR